MSLALQSNTLTETKLWKHLKTGYGETEHESLAAQLATNTESVCREAVERIKSMP